MCYIYRYNDTVFFKNKKEVFARQTFWEQNHKPSNFSLLSTDRYYVISCKNTTQEESVHDCRVYKNWSHIRGRRTTTLQKKKEQLVTLVSNERGSTLCLH